MTKKYIDFDLEKYLVNPDQPVFTRSGNPVNILTTNKRGTHYSIVVLVEKSDGFDVWDDVVVYPENGKFHMDKCSELDLVFPVRSQPVKTDYGRRIVEIGDTNGMYGIICKCPKNSAYIDSENKIWAKWYNTSKHGVLDDGTILWIDADECEYCD